MCDQRKMSFDLGSRMFLAFFCLQVVALARGAEVVEITKFYVPPQPRLHENVTMLCQHSLKPGRLNTLQWYHNEHEFFRYAADEDEPRDFFPYKNLNVSREESTETEILLLNVSLAAAGEYECRVRSESPDFKDVRKKANMTVNVIPNAKPQIKTPPGEGLRIGSEVNLNCSAPPSIPVATLEWEVNGKKVPEGHLRHYPPVRDDAGLLASTLGLHFKLEGDHFVDSELLLKCIAKIATFYHEYDQHSQPSLSERLSGQGEPPAEPTIGNSMNNAGLAAPWSLWLILGAFVVAR